MVKIESLQYLQIGVQGENAANTLEIDMTSWVSVYPSGNLHILFKPYNSSVAVPVLSEYDAETKVLSWTPTFGVTATPGVGYTEIRLLEPTANTVKKSRIVPTSVETSVSGIEVNPPEPYAEWVNSVLQAADEAEAAQQGAEAAEASARDAVTRFPRIDYSNYHWLIWDAGEENWVDTEILAIGQTGAQGPQGPQGIQSEYIHIAKVYDTVEDMGADIEGTDVSPGQLVAVASEDAGDDNGSVYIKGNSAYVFMFRFTNVDTIQGAQGPTGAQGVQGNPGQRGYGVAAGGSKNQVLTKGSDVDFDTVWKSPVDLIYPVGSIYMNVNLVSPSTLWPGTTWEALKDRFLIGAGENYLPGSTGGSSTHTLTTSEIPSHTHSFTGSTVASGNVSDNHTHTIAAFSINTEYAGSHSHGGWWKGGGSGSIPFAIDYDTRYQSTGSRITQDAGNHRHTVNIPETTSGNQSTGHTHNVTASGTIGNTGGGEAFSIMPPYLSVYMWKRTA